MEAAQATCGIDTAGDHASKAYRQTGMIAIRTDRLILRKPQVRDQATLVAQLNNWEVVRWLSSVPYPYEFTDAHGWFKQMKEEPLNLSIFRSSRLIGGIRLHQEEDLSCDFGFWLAQESWGQGLMTEAADALLSHAESHLAIRNVHACHFEGNHASARVLHKLGFHKVGEGRQYSIALDMQVPIVRLRKPADDALAIEEEPVRESS